MTRSATQQNVLAAVLIVITLAFYVAMQREGNGWGGDFGLYLMHARNLAHLQPYAHTAFVYDPEGIIQSPPMYPPGLPLLLAPVYALRGLDYRALKLVCELCLVLSLYPFYQIARRRLGDHAVWMIPVVGLTYPFLSLKDTLASEAPFLLCSFWALERVQRDYESGSTETQPFWRGALAGALFTGAYVSRSVGIALVLGLAAYDIIRNRRLTRYLVAAILTFVVLNVAISHAIGGTTSYAGQFVTDASSVGVHLWHFVRDISMVWMNGQSNLLRRASWLFFIVLAVIGFGARVPRRLEFPEWYTMAFVAGTSLYHADDFRYLIPVVPIVLLWIAEALQLVAARAPRAVGRLVVGGAVALTAIAALGNMRTLDRDRVWNGVEDAKFQAVTTWMRGMLAPNAAVVSWNPRVVGLYSDRTGLTPLPDTAQAHMKSYYLRHNVTHDLIALDESVEEPRRAFVAHHPDWYELVYQNERYRLYRVHLPVAGHS